MKTVLHLNDRLSQRGGADIHLLAVLEAQVEGSEDPRGGYHLWKPMLAVGFDDDSATAPCDVYRLQGLETRTPTSTDLRRLLDRLQPDLIHVHNVMNPMVLEALYGEPVVMTVQDHRTFCPFRGKWTLRGEPCLEPMSRDACRPCFEDVVYFEHIYELTERRLAAIRPFQLTVLSCYMKRELALVGMPEEQVEVIPPFVHRLDPGALSLEHPTDATGSVMDAPRAVTHAAPCVLFCGRMVEAKGVLDAIDAWRRSGVSLPMVLSGTGSLRARVARDHPDCKLLGWTSHDRLGALLRRTRVVVMPSRWQEPFGIIGLEALSQAVPVAAWDSGGVREWYPGLMLPKWGDVDALAHAIRSLVDTRATAPSEFDRERLMARLDGVYGKVARQADRPRCPATLST